MRFAIELHDQVVDLRASVEITESSRIRYSSSHYSDYRLWHLAAVQRFSAAGRSGYFPGGGEP